MAATTLGFIPLQLIQTNAMGHYSFDKGFATNGTYVVVKTPTVAQQLQLTKSIKDLQNGKEINNNEPPSKPVILRCKRRVDFSGLGCKLVDSQNPSVSRRNERERKRVKMVNMGFETLRQHVPSGRKNKKMSKVETLRSAVQYIKQLKEMLSDTESGVSDMLPENMDMDELESKVTELIQNVANADGNQSDMEATISGELENTRTAAPTETVNNNSEQMQQLQDIQLHHHQQHHDIHSQQQHDIHHHQQQQHQQQQQQQQLDQLHQQLSPAESTPDLPNSPTHFSHHEQYYQSYQHANMFQYDTVPSAYSQSSTAGSLHSPTSSVVSDSSYDSFGDTAPTPDDDDLLSGLTSWF